MTVTDVTAVTDVTSVTTVMCVTRVTDGRFGPSVTSRVLPTPVTDRCGSGRANTRAWPAPAGEAYTPSQLLPLPAGSVTSVTPTGARHWLRRAAAPRQSGCAPSFAQAHDL